MADQSRRPGIPLLTLACLCFALCGPVPGHGGSYRGPGFAPTPPTSSPPSGPPAGGGTPPPRPPRGGSTLDLRTWETWWGLNREEFLPSRGTRNDGVLIDGYERNEAKTPSRSDIEGIILPFLKGLLDTERNQEIRDSAALALGRAGGEAEVPILKALADDRQGSVREAAILGLGLIESPGAESLLAGFATDESRLLRERTLAIMALGISGGEVARDLLLRQLGTAYPEHFTRRARAGHFESLRALAAMLTEKQDLLPANAPAAPHPALGHIIKALRADEVADESFQPLAMAALAKSRDTAAGPIVLTGLRHRKSTVRAGAAIAAGRVFIRPDEGTMRRLVAAFNEESDQFARRMLLISLGRMGGEGARDFLLRYHRTADRMEQNFVLLALALTRDQAVLPLLRSSLADARDASSRGAASIALGIIGDRESFELLTQLIESDRNPAVRAYAMEALTVMGEVRAAPQMEKMLTSQRQQDVVAAAAQGLGLLGVRESIPLLVQTLRSSSSVPERGAIAYGMGRMGDRLVIQPLIEIARDRDVTDLVRAFAVVALGIVAERSPRIPPFSRTTIDSHYAIQIDVLTELRDIL